jgi:hypothetical protein
MGIMMSAEPVHLPLLAALSLGYRALWECTLDCAGAFARCCWQGSTINNRFAVLAEIINLAEDCFDVHGRLLGKMMDRGGCTSMYTF